MDPKDELLGIRDQLEMIEIQIQDLLDQQQQLRERQEYLEKLITHTAITGTSTGHADTQDWSKSDFKWSAKLNEIKSSVFGIKKFRPLQEQTMNATMGGKDCILIMPTGGGKSLCFQLTALASPGVTLVVSPLVSLMEDQLMALHKHDIRAEMLNASSSKEKVKAVHDAMTTKGNPLKLLYVTPEKLAKSKRFMNKLEKMYDAGRFSRLAIDEIHCCSQWGHDFRPDYKFLGVMRRQFPGVPILGLTATATTNVLEDVKKILGIPDCIIFRASFNRPNLFYEVRAKPTSIQNFLDDAQKLIETRFQGKSGIIYCLTQKDSEEVARGLQSRGIKACCYHANLDCKYRSQVHTRWTNNQLQVVVATIAFGMGIDKPDVRFVIHHSISKSMENYYQESGRAGRDDKRSYCILYYHLNDMFRQSTMVMTEQTGVEKLYGMIDYAISHSKCRRTLIARYFGETWDSTQCNKMCDSCDDSTGQETVTKTVNTYCNDIITLLEHASKTKTRMTALKLVDAWLGKGSTALRLSHVKTPQLPREDCERLIALMLLQGNLKEDFHFTPYSTISYLVKGPKARLLSSGKEVTMDIKVTRKTTPTSSAASSIEKGKKQVTKKSDKSSTSKEKDKKVKPCFINKEKSMFTQHSDSQRTDLRRQRTESPTFPSVKKSTGSTSVDSVGTIGSPENGSVSKSADKRKSESSSTKVKRRKIVIESDSEDGFDFSDMWSGEPSTSTSKTDSKNSSGTCVVLSDDSDAG